MRATATMIITVHVAMRQALAGATGAMIGRAGAKTVRAGAMTGRDGQLRRTRAQVLVQVSYFQYYRHSRHRHHNPHYPCNRHRHHLVYRCSLGCMVHKSWRYLPDCILEQHRGRRHGSRLDDDNDHGVGCGGCGDDDDDDDDDDDHDDHDEDDGGDDDDDVDELEAKEAQPDNGA